MICIGTREHHWILATIGDIWRGRHIFLSFLGHELGCKGAPFQFFSFALGSCLSLPGFLAGAAALQILLDPRQVHLAILTVQCQSVVLGGHEHVRSRGLPLVQHLLNQVLVRLVKILITTSRLTTLGTTRGVLLIAAIVLICLIRHHIHLISVPIVMAILTLILIIL